MAQSLISSGCQNWRAKKEGKKKVVKIAKFLCTIILDVMSFQNLQKLSKNLHPVPRYSSSKLVHFSCQNQFWRYNSVYGSRPLSIMIGLNLGNPWAPSLKKSSIRLVFFICYGAPKRPLQNKHLRKVFWLQYPYRTLQEFEIPSEASPEGALQNIPSDEKICFSSAKIWPDIFIFETPCIS